MADLVTRLFLDSKQFDNNIVKSSRQVQQFQKLGKAMTTSLISGLKNIAGPLGIAVTGMEAFSTAINANSSLQYTWNSAMDGAKASVNDFFVSLTTGDWSKFKNGLLSSVKGARELSAEMKTLQLIKGTEKEKADYYEGRKNSAEAMINAARTEEEASRALDEWYYYDAMEKAARNKAINAAELEPLKEAHGWGATEIKSGKELLDIVTKYIPGSEPFKQLKAYADKRIENENNLNYYLSLLGNPNTNSKERDKWWLKVDELKQERNHMIWENPEFEKSYKLLPHLTDDYIKKTQESLSFIGEQHDKTGTADMAANAIIDTFNTAVEKIKKAKVGGTIYGSGNSGGAVTTEETKEYVKDLSTIKGIESEIAVKREQMKNAKLDEVKAIADEVKFLEWMKNNLENGKGTGILDFSWVDKPKGKGDNPIINTDKIKATLDWAESLNLVASAMGSISQMTNEGASAWLTWGANIMTSVATAIPAITALIALKKEEAVANAAAEAAKTPLIGWLTVGAAVAAVAAAMFSIPKFATGGIVGGNSYSGDRIIAGLNSGEMVLNGALQRNLFNLINNGSTGASQVEFKIRGKELVGVLNNYNKQTSRV